MTTRRDGARIVAGERHVVYDDQDAAEVATQTRNRRDTRLLSSAPDGGGGPSHGASRPSR